MGVGTLYEDMARLEAEGRAFVLATVIDTGGSTPRKAGSKLVLCEDGVLLGTIGGGAIEQQVLDAARELLASPSEKTRTLDTHLTHDLGMCCGGKMRVFLEKHSATSEVVVFGGGHVGQALGRLATQVGFSVTVVDGRSEWSSRERHPDVRTLAFRDPLDVARSHLGGANTFYCVTTHDHALDQALVEALLPKPRAYLGVIGSRRKAERFKLRLRAQGVDEAELSTLRSPMGLPIAAQSPEEIAVSIVAELIAVRAEKALPTAAKRLRAATLVSG